MLWWAKQLMQQHGIYNPILTLFLNDMKLIETHYPISLCNRLDLNLRSGKNKNDDIILNISVDFHEKIITRNSRISGEWGLKEFQENLEREDNNLNPIEPGEF